MHRQSPTRTQQNKCKILCLMYEGITLNQILGSMPILISIGIKNARPSKLPVIYQTLATFSVPHGLFSTSLIQ